MAYVKKEGVLKRLKTFSQDELSTIRTLFMVTSNDSLAAALVRFINYQPQETITYSLMIDAIENKARKVDKHLNTVKQNARNN